MILPITAASEPAPVGEPSAEESATAYWQFAGSSHFTRAFKTRYGQTPTEYAHRCRT